MDEYEQLLRDGLREAAGRRPFLEVDPWDAMAHAIDRDEPPNPDPTPVAEPEPVPALAGSSSPGGAGDSSAGSVAGNSDDTVARARPSSAGRWAIGLAAAAAGAGLLIVLPGALAGRPIEATPAQTVTATPPPSQTPTGTPAQTPTPSEPPPTRWALAQTIAPDDLPLTRYWDAVRRASHHENQVMAASEYRRWWDAREAYLPQCMAKEGFEYVPRWRAWEGPEPGSEAEARDLIQDHNRLRIPTLDPDRAVVAQVGYGLRSVADELPGQHHALIVDDQNDEYREDLSKAEQDRYDNERGGCMAQFQRKNPMPKTDDWDDFATNRFSDLIGDMIGFHSMGASDDIEADPRIIELNTEYRTCAAASGLPIEDARARAKKPGPWDGPIEALQIAFRTGADGVAAELGDNDPERDDQKSLVGSAPEIRIALIDYDCRAATDYLERFIAVQREREQAFENAHGKELAKLMSYIEKQVP